MPLQRCPKSNTWNNQARVSTGRTKLSGLDFYPHLPEEALQLNRQRCPAPAPGMCSPAARLKLTPTGTTTTEEQTRSQSAGRGAEVPHAQPPAVTSSANGAKRCLLKTEAKADPEPRSALPSSRCRLREFCSQNRHCSELTSDAQRHARGNTQQHLQSSDVSLARRTHTASMYRGKRSQTEGRYRSLSHRCLQLSRENLLLLEQKEIKEHYACPLPNMHSGKNNAYFYK